MSKHRIIVLGAGYVGVLLAGQLARRLRAEEASVTLVSAHATRDERMRWHQLAAGQSYPELPIADALKGSGVEFTVAHADRVDPERRLVHLDGGNTLGYDSLVVALGSVIDDGTVPGAREHAHGLTDARSVSATADELAALADGERVTVIGGGLTGIELATEIAESHPRLRVTITSTRPAGDWLSTAGRRELTRAFDRLGIDQVVGRTARIEPDAVHLADGRILPSALTFWAGGFRANPLLEASGFEVDEVGRAVVDSTLHAVSHHDVWVVGDAARVPGRDGVPLKMGCRTGAFMALAAPRMIADELSGQAAKPFSARYFAECISLGRRSALLQWLTAEGTAKEQITAGRTATLIKEFVHRGNLFVARHPGPYVPVRRAHVRVGSEGHREMIGA